MTEPGGHSLCPDSLSVQLFFPTSSLVKYRHQNQQKDEKFVFSVQIKL